MDSSLLLTKNIIYYLVLESNKICISIYKIRIYLFV